MSDLFSERRLALVIPATVLATASLGAVLYCSGRMGFHGRFPYVSFSLKRSFASVRPRTPPKLGAPVGGLTADSSLYPWVHRDTEMVERKFGVDIQDPYRCLEDPAGPRTAAFIESQNFFAAQVLERCETREKFKLLFTEMYNTPKFGCPHEEAGRYYFSFNAGLQNQSCLYFCDGDFSKPNLFLDPNEWSEDGTVALTSTSFSEQGKLVGYCVSSGGSDWQKIKVLRVKDKPENDLHYEELKDELNFVRSSAVAWTHDEKGFFYSRFPDANVAENGTLGRQNVSVKYHTLCYHVLGTSQNEDVTVLKLDDKPDYLQHAEVSEDGNYLIIQSSPGCSPGNTISFMDLRQLPKDGNGVMRFTDCRSKIIPLVAGIEDAFEFIANEGSVFTFTTNKDAPREKLVRVDVNNPTVWTDVVPQHEKDVLERVCAIKEDKMVLCYLRDCSYVLELRRFSSGEKIREIDIPNFGSVTSLSGKKTSSEVFFAHQSTVVPPTIYRYQVEENALSVVHQTMIPGYRPDDYETTQVFVDSYDEKAKIPMFVTQKKGTVLDGNNPTLLTGYGGFGINQVPRFSVSQVGFVLAYGGVFASANLRGGNEYGLEWRKAGSLENKQNVFDDFQACSEFLIEKKYCNPSRLAIRGGSNGGLLVAACANQRPDLYGCVVCEAAVLDMLRYHLFTIGHAWVPEYGDPEQISDFEYLVNYSPLHNIRAPSDGTHQYPSLLLTSGDHDDRVSPLHTFKFVAELQHKFCSGSETQQTNPLIARIETKAGHGAGKPTALIIDEVADIMGFVAEALKAEWRLN